MRPLRLARTPLLADTVSSLMGAMPNLGNAALINLLFIYIFSILGVQLLCGKVSFCADLKFKNKIECLENGSTWETPP